MRKNHPLALGYFALFLCLSTWVFADPPAPPGWWFDTTNGTAILNGNTANNSAPVTLGQLKNVAANAKNYLDIKLSGNGGAGSAINSMVASFSTNAGINLAIANNGQLKFVAQPFYDRLRAVGYNITTNLTAYGLPGNWSSGNFYPWPEDRPPRYGAPGYDSANYTAWLQKQYAPANLGQLKFVFSFDLGNVTGNTGGNTSGSTSDDSGPTFQRRFLFSPTEDEPEDDNYAIPDSDFDMAPVEVPQYSIYQVGTGHLVDMNDNGEVLVEKTATNEDQTYSSSYIYWDGNVSLPVSDIIDPDDFQGDNPGFPGASHYEWLRLADDGSLLGMVSALNTDVPRPARWRYGQKKPYIMPEGAFDEFIDANHISFSWTLGDGVFYADSDGNIYLKSYQDASIPTGENDEEGHPITVSGDMYAFIEWTRAGELIYLGNSVASNTTTLHLAYSDEGDELTARLFYDYNNEDYHLDAFVDHVNLYINGHLVGEDVDWDTDSLIKYSRVFSEWGGIPVLGGGVGGNSLVYYNEGVGYQDLTDSPGGGTAQFVAGISSVGVAVTGTGLLWANSLTRSVPGGDNVFLNMITANDYVLAGHYGPDATTDNSTEIIILKPVSPNIPLVPPPGISMPASEMSGAVHRKIALNGRPLPDGKPQTAPESDQQPEETFVDALTLALRHSVTDLYASIPGSDLALSVNRVYAEEAWDVYGGLQPTAHIDWPFGPAWRSNLAPGVRLEYTEASLLNAYVTDEDGEEYHFLGGFIYKGDDVVRTYNFVPYPSSKHEKNTYQATLELEDATTLAGANATLVLRKKYGTTVRYKRATSESNAANIGPGAPTEEFVFFRGELAEDRRGYQKEYHYGNSTALVPDYIAMHDSSSSHTALPGAYMNITTYENTSLVHTVAFSDNETVTYGYELFDDSSNSSNPKLANVTVSQGNVSYGTVGYAYAMTDEWDQSVNGLTAPYVPRYSHLNLTGITDQNGHTYEFDYQLPYADAPFGTKGFLKFDGSAYWPAFGHPQMVKEVRLPGGAGNTTFTPNILVKVQTNFDSPGMHKDSVRELVVKDAEDKEITYKWEGAAVVMQDVALPLLEDSPDSWPCLVRYDVMTITYGNLGTETFTFDPEAGMALATAEDLSGGFTQYTYGDRWHAPEWYRQILPSADDIYGEYDDPTEEIDAEYGIKRFSYTEDRLMSDVVDANGNLTHYVFDGGGLGLRVAEQHYAGGIVAGTPAAETDYEYANDKFAGLVTKRTVAKQGSGDPGWVTDRVTNSNLTWNGTLRRETEEVVLGNVSLTTNRTYSNTGDLLSTLDARGNTTAFAYDGRHRLTGVTYPGSGSRNYTYDARGNQLSERDENGHYTVRHYDALNRVDQVVRVLSGNDTSIAAGLYSNFTYGNTGARLSATDPNGGVTTYGYDELNRLITMTQPEVSVGGSMVAPVTHYGYEGTSGGNAFDSSSFKPTVVTGPRAEQETDFTYDHLGRLVKQSVLYDLGDVGNFVAPSWANVTNTYDHAGRLTERADDWQDVKYTYDALDRQVKVAHWGFDYELGAAVDIGNTTVAYTTTGLAYLKTDELGRETGTEYDAAGRVVKVTLADPATGAITGSSPTILTAYDENNNVTRVTNPLGANTTYAYDARNRKISETLPAAADWSNGGTPGARVTAWGYDAAGNTLNVTTNLTHNTPSVTAMEYDAANRVTYTFTPGVQVWNGTGATGAYLATNTSYDDNGNVLMVQQGTATSQDHTGFSASRNTTVNTYDALNRLLTTTDGAGITVGYGYDEAGNRVLVSDGLSHNTTFSYDGLNRVLVIDYPVGSNTVYAYGPTHVDSIFNGHATTYFGYDQRERVTGRTGYNFYYDRAGELVGAEAWDWDAVHELGLTRYSDVSYAYDGLGRVIAENQGGENSGDIPEDVFGDHFAGNITGGVTNTYAYDAAGNRLAAHYDIAGGNRTLNSTYDALNRVANITDVTSGNLVTAYHYDLGGRRNGLLYPSGSNITTGFDALGRQTAITGAGNATTTRYALALDYDEFNNLGRQAETYANGMLASRNVTLSYDGADRLTREVLARSGGATITSNYTYDDAYNRTAKVTSNTSNSTIVANVTYHFNDGNQLDWFHDVTANTTANYTYDGAGNRLTLSFNGHDVGGNYNYTNTAVYYYDAANRLEEADLHTLVAASSNHTTQRYAEDFYLYGYDHRTRRTSMGQERLELSGNYIRLKEDWFDGGSPIRQSDANYTLSHTPMGNATTREFIRGSDWGGGVGGILYSLAGNATTAKYYHYDGRGDVVAQTGNTGAVTYQAEYDAYGKHDNVAAKGTQTSGTNNDPFQANTKEEDPTGFVNMGFRMYDLETGVFTTADPLGYGDGLNRYTFVHQNSWSKFDPEGLAVSPQMNFYGGADGGQVPHPDQGPTAPMNPRLAGLIGAVGSGIEMVAGVATLETGWGGVAAIHGADNFGANLAQIISNKRATSVTETAITQATGSEKAGVIGNAVIGIAAPIGSGVVASKMAGAEAKVAVLMTEDAKATSAGITPSVSANPAIRSLTNIQARDWYNSQVSNIAKTEAGMRAQGKSAEEIFNVVTKMRNDAKLQARALMKDQSLAESLPSPQTPEVTLQKYGGDHETAIEATKRTNAEVNKKIENKRASGEQ